MKETTTTMNPAATDHLPVFVTQPGDTDALLVFTAIFLLVFIIGIGLVYWRLHALPEQLAHRGEKIQYQFVAVLGCSRSSRTTMPSGSRGFCSRSCGCRISRPRSPPRHGR